MAKSFVLWDFYLSMLLQLEVQSNLKCRIRYSYGYLAQITVPSVFTGCNLTNKNVSTAMEIKTQSIYFQFSLLLSQLS